MWQREGGEAASLPEVNTTAVTAVPVSIFLGVVGVVFGMVALRQIRRTGERGARLAILAIVLGPLTSVAGYLISGHFVGLH